MRPQPISALRKFMLRSEFRRSSPQTPPCFPRSELCHLKGTPWFALGSLMPEIVPRAPCFGLGQTCMELPKPFVVGVPPSQLVLCHFTCMHGKSCAKMLTIPYVLHDYQRKVAKTNVMLPPN